MMKPFKVRFPEGYHIEDAKKAILIIHVILPDKTVFYLTFVTMDYIASWQQQKTDPYFWVDNMVVVRDLQRDTIKLDVEDMLGHWKLQSVGEKIGTIRSVYRTNQSYEELEDELNGAAID